MGNKTIMFFYELFYELQEKGQNGYMLISLALPLDQLYKLYIKWEVSEIPPIETLSDEEKTKYWNIAKTFYTDQTTAIKASKSAYVLDLITNSN